MHTFCLNQIYFSLVQLGERLVLAPVCRHHGGFQADPSLVDGVGVGKRCASSKQLGARGKGRPAWASSCRCAQPHGGEEGGGCGR